MRKKYIRPFVERIMANPSQVIMTSGIDPGQDDDGGGAKGNNIFSQVPDDDKKERDMWGNKIWNSGLWDD